MTAENASFEPSGLKADRLIALEFNELCPSLLARWMDEGILPNFARLHRQSEIYITRPDVSDPGLLEPWIQWYSIHTGLSYDTHRVFHLTEGPRAGHADIFRILREAGRKVAAFGSMNVAPFASQGSIFLGDPWSENGDAFPPELNRFNRFVSHNVREYSNASDRMGARDYAGFLAFMATHGLSAATIAKIAAQLATERLKDRQLAYRRVAILDRLQFDVFSSYYRRARPDFASFFSNSVAHLQHSYWRHMDPEPFTVKPDAAELAIYSDAIRHAYQAIDRLLGKFLVLAEREDATLMFITALSQQPFLRYEDKGGQHFHRLHGAEAFLRDLAIDFLDMAPTMTHQYLVQFACEADARMARDRLSSLRLDDGRALFGFPQVEGQADALYFGCQIATKVDAASQVIDPKSNRTWRFGELFYRIEASKSGRHHPDGCLWIQSGRHREHAFKPSILDILPTQLEMLGVPAPLFRGEGQSLIPAMAG